MTATSLFATTQGVLARPPTTGLVASAPPAPDDGDRWTTGIAWVPERCGADYQLVAWCSPDDLDAFAEQRATGAYYRPVGARFKDECSTLGGELNVERLRRTAEAATPFVVAQELWTGTKSQDDSWTAQGVTHSNAYLASADATVVGDWGTGLLSSLAVLEQSAMEATRGQQVMIHLPVMLNGGLAEYVRRVGNMLLTRQDNIVVVDAGYPGTGPNGEVVGTTAWAYATPPVQVRTSELQFITAPGQTVDRSTNTVTTWAERVFAAFFDPCAHFATEITI